MKDIFLLLVAFTAFAALIWALFSKRRNNTSIGVQSVLINNSPEFVSDSPYDESHYRNWLRDMIGPTMKLLEVQKKTANFNGHWCYKKWQHYLETHGFEVYPCMPRKRVAVGPNDYLPFTIFLKVLYPALEDGSRHFHYFYINGHSDKVSSYALSDDDKRYVDGDRIDMFEHVIESYTSRHEAHEAIMATAFAQALIQYKKADPNESIVKARFFLPPTSSMPYIERPLGIMAEDSDIINYLPSNIMVYIGGQTLLVPAEKAVLAMMLYLQDGISVLLSGPPGTGKTQLMYVLASKLRQSIKDLGIYVMDGGSFLSFESNPASLSNYFKFEPAIRGTKTIPNSILLFDEAQKTMREHAEALAAMMDGPLLAATPFIMTYNGEMKEFSSKLFRAGRSVNFNIGAMDKDKAVSLKERIKVQLLKEGGVKAFDDKVFNDLLNKVTYEPGTAIEQSLPGYITLAEIFGCVRPNANVFSDSKQIAI